MTNEAQTTSSCCSTGPANPAADAGAKNLLGAAAPGAPVAPADPDDMTVCPVMAGTPVTKSVAVAAGLFRDYEGERYYFCCAGCGPAFDADPAKYAASMA